MTLALTGAPLKVASQWSVKVIFILGSAHRLLSPFQRSPHDASYLPVTSVAEVTAAQRPRLSLGVRSRHGGLAGQALGVLQGKSIGPPRSR